MEVAFYQVNGRVPASVDATLPKLIEKIVSRGLRVLVVCPSAERADRVNDFLWEYEPESFLPHGHAEEPMAASQPVLVDTKVSLMNNPQVLLLVGGCAPANVGVPEGVAKVLDIFDSSDSQTAQARLRWREWKEQNTSLAYFAYENGRWEKKA